MPQADRAKGAHRMDEVPVVVGEDERAWEAMGGEEASDSVLFKTLISGGLTKSEALTAGVAKIPPGAALSKHRHRQAEVYLVLAGEGSVRVGEGVRSVRAGSAVFVPGGAVHSCENTSVSELRLAYILAADSFEDVEYVFEE